MFDKRTSMLELSSDQARPPSFSFALEHVAAPRRFAVMREMLADCHPPLVQSSLIADRLDAMAPFDAGFWMRDAGPLSYVEHASDAVIYTRSAREIARSPVDAYGLFLQMEGAWHLTQGGREQYLAPGSLILLDANEPFRSVKPGRFRHRLLRIPRAQADSLMVPGWQRTGAYCEGSAGLGRVIAHYARTLTDEIDHLTPREASEALSNLCRLFAVGMAGQPARTDRSREALRSARLAQVCRYIDRHWADTDLTPAVAATNNGLSERGLHMLFQPTDTSFAQHVQRRRLEECRSMLANPAHAEQSIADIAFFCGFNSLATFYRGFHRMFGASPGEFRAVMGQQA
jgi:AraC-like DNA-binding protein